MARSPSSSRLRVLCGAGAIAALTTACGIIAGIEDFNLVEADAGGLDADPVDVGATDGGTTVDDATPLPPFDASVEDGGPDGRPDVTTTDTGTADVIVDTGVDSTPVDTGPTCTCPSVLQTCTPGNVCTPAVFAAGRADPRSIIVEKSNVVWAEWGASQIVFCPTSGCTATPSVSVGPVSNPVIRHSINGGPSTAFFSGSAPIDTIQASGVASTVVPGPVDALGAALTNGAAAWATTDSIWICLTSGGCTSQQKLIASTGPISGPAMFRISSRVFWTPPSGGVSSCVTTNCGSPINWGQPGAAVVDFDTDNTNLVTATVGASAVVTSYDMGGTLEKTVGLGRTATSLVMGGSKIFVGTTTGVVAIDRATFTATLLYPGNVQGIALGTTEIFWTDASGFVFHAPN